MSHCQRALVSGKVQGVGYRRATQKQAIAEQVTGHARNLPDGRVDVLMCGEPDALERLAEWLWKGPAQARVTQVEMSTVAGCQVPSRFSTE
ncbi:acylphosphatase [Halomonas aquamarina]|uniref:Acylphosphatase n=1 Tax=Vreelandella aquamarina TaxID=77097 RepID=A0ACC5VUS7_9GAMM|nr:acylphosphatase [Halomonas aquamarina]